jgi:Uma2 family endonuclease
MAQTVELLTADDLFKMPSSLRYELIDGVLIEMSPPGEEHGGVAGNIAGLLFVYAREHRVGRVLTEVGYIVRRNPDTVRAPDVAFVRTERIPGGQLSRRFSQVAPDLIVEVVSPYDTPTEVQTKVHEWIEFGVNLVWVVYPESRTVTIIRSLQERFNLTHEDVLDGGEVLPGFSCRVSELFE